MWSQFSLETLQPQILIRRYDDSRGNRFYWFEQNGEVKIAAGVTTVIGLVSTERRAIEQWKENNDNWKQMLNASSDYGTRLHEIFGDVIQGKGVSRDKMDAMRKIAVENGSSFDMATKDVLSFLKFHEDYNLTPLIIEGMLLWQDTDGEYLAMTIDLLARLTITRKEKKVVEDGVYVRGDKKGQPKYKDVTEEITEEKIVLMDFKSNFFEKDRKTFYEAHKMQLIAGARAVEQNFNIKVDALYNMAPGNTWHTEPSYTFKQQEVSDDDIKTFEAYWNLAKTKGLNKPNGKILVTGEFKNSTDFKLLTYEEYVRDVLMKEPTALDNIIDGNITRMEMASAFVKQMGESLDLLLTRE